MLQQKAQNMATMGEGRASLLQEGSGCTPTPDTPPPLEIPSPAPRDVASSWVGSLGTI